MFKKLSRLISLFQLSGDKDKNADYFAKEHAEDFEYVYSAMFSDIEHLEKLPGNLVNADILLHSDVQGRTFTILKDRGDTDISMVYTLERISEGENDFLSVFPVFKGIDHAVKLKDYYTWESGGEGEFAVETAFGDIICFYDPFYCADINNFRRNETKTVSLSALAFDIEKMEEREFTAESGNFYEYALERFLKEHPGKRKEDFAPPVIRLDASYFRMFFPRETSCMYEVAGQVEDIAFTEFSGVKFMVLKVNFKSKMNGEFFYINLYAAPHVAGSCKPEVGDAVSAVIRVFGTFK